MVEGVVEAVEVLEGAKIRPKTGATKLLFTRSPMAPILTIANPSSRNVAMVNHRGTSSRWVEDKGESLQSPTWAEVEVAEASAITMIVNKDLTKMLRRICSARLTTKL